MAPTDNNAKKRNFTPKDGNMRKTKNMSAGVKKKRKWIPEHKQFQGSVKEGQGFAFQRKQKVRHEYNKLIRKERKRKPESKVLYKDEYPEHLKHLYMAEAEQLSKEAWEHRVKRSKLRTMKQRTEMDEEETAADEEVIGASASGNPQPSTSEKESLPMSNRMRKKMQKKTSYQKTKEEYEKNQEKRRKKKEEYMKNQQQRQEAIQRYKQKKMETFQMLSKKTKKGQPNLNLQMEYLLQKIQGANK